MVTDILKSVGMVISVIEEISCVTCIANLHAVDINSFQRAHISVNFDLKISVTNVLWRKPTVIISITEKILKKHHVAMLYIASIVTTPPSKSDVYDQHLG